MGIFAEEQRDGRRPRRAHAACVARDGRGVLLCGDSGAGKTSLAYHLARNGWTYVSDNECWIVRERGTLVAGNPARLRFRDSAVELFPELRGIAPRLHANGKMSVETAAGALGIATAEQCCATRVVFLRRQPGAFRLGARQRRNVPALPGHGSAGLRQDARHDASERGLAAAGFADQPDHLARPDRQ